MNPSASSAPSGRFATCTGCYPFYLPQQRLPAHFRRCRDVLTGQIGL